MRVYSQRHPAFSHHRQPIREDSYMSFVLGGPGLFHAHAAALEGDDKCHGTRGSPFHHHRVKPLLSLLNNLNTTSSMGDLDTVST